MEKALKIVGCNEHSYINLDLPSGTLWAITNIGAEKESDYGLYFAWGETKGFNKEAINPANKAFGLADYEFIDKDARIIKYNEDDKLIILEKEDDAAFINMGDNWHIPTKNQIKELINYTYNEWVSINDVYGMKFISKSDPSKYIFIPAAGWCHHNRFRDINECGAVWSSDINKEIINNAWYMLFGDNFVNTYHYYRDCGLPIRGVIG